MANMMDKEEAGEVKGKKKKSKKPNGLPKFGFGKKPEVGMKGRPTQYGSM